MLKILHCDMDAFFAAVEQRDDPTLRGRPIAVGGGGKRGVVMAASYEARAFGVRSAMPGRTAARACPDLIFVSPRMDVYRETGMQVRDLRPLHHPRRATRAGRGLSRRDGAHPPARDDGNSHCSRDQNTGMQ